MLMKSRIGSLGDLRRLKDAFKLTFASSFRLDYSFYSKILQLCINERSEKGGRLVHSHFVINGFASNECLNTKLVIFYSKVGDMVTAHHVFQKMFDRSVVSWSALISGYSQNGNPEEAFTVFSKMRREGIKPNQFTYGSVLRACTNMMCLERGKQIQGCIHKGRFVNNLFVQSALVDFHSKCGSMDDACYVFASILERDMVSWNTMIGGYAVRGLCNEAFLMFRSMLREGMVPDCFTLGSVLRNSFRSHSLMSINQIHSFVIQLGFESNNSVVGSLIDAYAKCRSVDTANKMYRSLLKKDIVSCTALITGYAREGYNIYDALELFNEVHQMHMVIDNILLCSMMSLCANTASLDIGQQIHAIVLKYQHTEDVAMCNALIDMYSKCGDIEDAERLFDEMPNKNIVSWTSLIAGYGKHGWGHKSIALYKRMEIEGLKPNDVTFLCLLFACSHSGLVSDGWKCFRKMVDEYNIMPRAEHYACMVDLFARGGQLEAAYDFISKMNAKPIASHWSAILGGCNIYGNMVLGEVAATNLFYIEPDKSVNYVVLAGLYAAIGMWNNACMTRKVLEARSLKKIPGSSCLLSMNKNVAHVPG